MPLLIKLFFGIIAFFYLNIFPEIGISETKGLFTIIKEEYKYLSPFQGMVWWKNNLIENMYRVGNDTHATIRLIKILFYLQKDGTFDCTRPSANIDSRNKPGNGAAYFTTEIITEFLLLLENNKTVEDLNSLKKRINKKFAQDFISRYSHVFPSDGNFVKNIRKILHLLCESSKESLDNSERKALYIPHMTKNILLACLWKKASSKQEFIDYFNNLEKNNINIIQEGNTNLFDNILEAKYVQEDLITGFDNLQETKAQNILDNYELSICSILSHKPIEVISHESSVKYKNEKFSDCGETLVLNFFNFILFDPKKNLFDINFIEQNGAQLNKNLKEFYLKNNRPESMSRKQIHDEWAVVVSDVPGVIYRQPNIPEKGNPKYCNIAGIGHSQILQILKYLLGIENFEELTKVCSRQNFKLSYKIKENYLNDYNPIIFYLNNNPVFELQSRRNHFVFKILENSNQNNLLSNQAIAELISKNSDIKALSLLSVTKSSTVFETLARNNFSTTSSSFLNFALVSPIIKDPDTNMIFIEILFESLGLEANPNSFCITEIIKKLYKQLPDDFYYRSLLAKLILKYRVKDLYNFLQIMFKEDPIGKASSDYRYYTLLENVLKTIIIDENSDLYDWFNTLFKMIEEIGFTQYFLEFLITDKEYRFTNIVNQPIKEFVANKFLSLTEDAKREICDLIIYNKLTDWYFLILSSLDSLGDNILTEIYGNNTGKAFRYQNLFSLLLRSNKQEIYESLMDRFLYMNNINKSIALKRFSNMQNWNTWIKNNFMFLNAGHDTFLLDKPLEVIALQLLIEQNNPSMKEFIQEKFLGLNKIAICIASIIIIHGNNQDFFYLIKNIFKKQDDNYKFEICKSIILYNRCAFYSLVSNYLLETGDFSKAYILKLIVSNKYLYKNNKISMLKKDLENNEETGFLIKQEDYKNWYQLVTDCLQQLPIEKKFSIIYIIKKNKVTGINIKSNIANLQFS